MARFTKLDPTNVVLGRGRAAQEARRPFTDALRASEAGRIDLERGERPASVKRLLQEAAKDLGLRVRSSWADDKQQSLLWKKTGTRS